MNLPKKLEEMKELTVRVRASSGTVGAGREAGEEVAGWEHHHDEGPEWEDNFLHGQSEAGNSFPVAAVSERSI